MSALELVQLQERQVTFARDQICCPPKSGVRFRECPLRENGLYMFAIGIIKFSVCLITEKFSDSLFRGCGWNNDDYIKTL